MMKTTTKESIEMKVGELNLSVPYTTDGLRAVRAIVGFLEAELTGEREIKGGEKVSPKSKGDSEKTGKRSEDQTTSPSPFSPPLSSPKQRIKFKNWTPIATTKSGTLYKEVVDRFLSEYKDGVEPVIENLSQITREMYGNELKEASIGTYVSQYKRYIRENKLAENSSKNHSNNECKKTLNLREIPIEKVVEIWNLLPDEFEYKQVKALIGASIQQFEARVDATNYIIREFKDNAEFGCEEPSPGIFLKITEEKGEED